MTMKTISAEEALRPVRSGQHVLVGSGAAEPQLLVEALAARGPGLSDVEVLHLLTLGPAPYADPRFEGHLRHNALFIGPNVRSAVTHGLADYTPCFLSEIPGLIRSGRLPVDVALLETTMPGNGGACSLGVAVDILKAAVDAAEYVVAQVNPRMPWTEGDSTIGLKDVDAFVLGDLPLFELPEPAPTAEALWIGRYVARLVEDGSTLQVGIGAVPNAVVASLSEKKDLGVHSEMISDGILALMGRGALTGRRKSLHPGKVVASFCLGTDKLYQAVDQNPVFELHPTEYVNDPAVIARNDRMVAVNAALQIDLTGQVAADSLGAQFHSGVGGQVDFIRGAARSRGGKSIITLPATAKGGSISRIAACLPAGTGVVTTRADIDFVVTEYGIASLKGKTIRERAVALIQIAHPSFRPALLEEAKKLGYLDAGHVVLPECGRYPADLEARRTFGAAEIFFRPIKPSDERRLKDLFYSQSQETTLLRFGVPLKRLSEEQFQKLVTIDCRNSMAVAGFAEVGGRERMIAVGRYCAAAGDMTAEVAVTVRDDFQCRGIGTFLLDYLAWIAKQKGFRALRAEVMAINPRMRHILDRCFRRVRVRDIGADGFWITADLEDWKGKENPALAEAVPLRNG